MSLIVHILYLFYFSYGIIIYLSNKNLPKTVERNTIMEEVLKFLQEAKTFYVATIDGNQPHVRPFGAVCGFEGKLYLITNNQKDVYKQMMANPKVEISATIDDRWIRLCAEVVLDDRREARKAMLDSMPSLRSMYNEDDGLAVALYLKNATATFCSFTSEPVTCNF